jgi:ABC-type transporter MlaC component
MMSRVASLWVVAVVALACLFARGAAAAPGPSDVVGHFHDALLSTMRNAAVLGVEGRYRTLEPVVLVVRTRLVKPDGERIVISDVLHDNDIAWRIRDIHLAGTISELATRRSDFAATLRDGGIEALILRLNKKADDLHGE